jgi:hypothetical protein
MLCHLGMELPIPASRVLGRVRVEWVREVWNGSGTQ